MGSVPVNAVRREECPRYGLVLDRVADFISRCAELRFWARQGGTAERQS
jgi:hypothetical protein